MLDRLLPRIASQIRITDSCWLWTGGLFQSSGYGRTKVCGHTYVVHRYIYEQLKGSVGKGLVLDHLCRVRHCVNPAHLEPVTSRTNVVVRGITITRTNAEKMHCIRGHALSGSNLFIRNDGRRRCKTCESASQKRLHATAHFKQWRADYERRRRNEEKKAATA